MLQPDTRLDLHPHPFFGASTALTGVNPLENATAARN
jgi:hypothetical protein